MAPCVIISSLLTKFAKVSEKHLPYAFYRQNKTLALACVTPTDKPLTSIKLKSDGGDKDLYLVNMIFVCIICLY